MAATRPRTRKDKYWIALDAGGTLTDTVIVDTKGQFLVGKSLTNKQDESQSFLSSIKDGAASDNRSVDTTLGNSDVIVYAGTIMLNTLLSKTGAKVGLMVSQGFEDYLLMEKGEGGWISYPYTDRLHTVTHHHEDPAIPRSRIVGVQGRLDMFGTEVIPLRKKDVEERTKVLINFLTVFLWTPFVRLYVKRFFPRPLVKLTPSIQLERLDREKQLLPKI